MSQMRMWMFRAPKLKKSGRKAKKQTKKNQKTMTIAVSNPFVFKIISNLAMSLMAFIYFLISFSFKTVSSLWTGIMTI